MVRFDIMAVEIGPKAAVPLVTARVSCGFPSPAEDHIDSSVDLNELMIQNVPATFIVQVKGDSMIDIGILPNDYAVVNKAIRPADKAVVVAIVVKSRPTVPPPRRSRKALYL